jgi:hypothetical protein
MENMSIDPKIIQKAEEKKQRLERNVDALLTLVPGSGRGLSEVRPKMLELLETIIDDHVQLSKEESADEAAPFWTEHGIATIPNDKVLGWRWQNSHMVSVKDLVLYLKTQLSKA